MIRAGLVSLIPAARTALAVTIGLLAVGWRALPARQADPAVEIRTAVDRTRITIGRQFALTIEIAGEKIQAAALPDPPDLSAFAQFRGSSSSQNISIVNGRMSVTRASISYYIASVEGRHTIPKVSLTFQGETVRSQPITIEIVKGSGSSPPASPSAASGPGDPGAGITPADSLEGNLFLKLETDRKRVYRHQPVILTARLYTRVDLTNYGVTGAPELSSFWIEDIDLPQPVRTSREEIDGRTFLVGEIKRSALFPTDSGSLTIPPMEIECEVRLRRRSSRSAFDGFFDEDVFNSGLFGRVERTRISSQPLTIEALPLPEEGRPEGFSGAVGQYRMEAAFDREKAKANEAVTLKVTISGTGNIKMLPEPEIVFPADLETYQPRISQSITRKGSSIQGSKSFEYVVLPRLGGEFRLNPVIFSYFDPEAGEYRTLESPEFLLEVEAGVSPGDHAPRGLTREEIRFVGRDIRFIKEEGARFGRAGFIVQRSTWFWLVALLPLAALSGAFFYQRRMEKMSEDAAYARSRRARRVARNRLAAAHHRLKPDTRSEFHAELTRAVLGYVADRLNLPAAGLDHDRAADLLRSAGISHELAGELRDCVERCALQRFAQAESGIEEMKVLYSRARRLIMGLERSRWEADR